MATLRPIPHFPEKIGPMRALLLPLFLSALPFPALAADGCAALVESTAVIERQDGFAVRDLHDGCAVENGLFKSSSQLGWRFDRAEVEGDGLIDLLTNLPAGTDRIPSWGRFSIEGARFTSLLDNALANYITTVQQWPMDVSGSFRYDAKDGYLHIQEAQLTQLRVGKMVFAAELMLPKDSDLQKLAASGSVGLKHLRLRLDNQGLFESLAVPTLTAFLHEWTGTDDPAQSIGQLRDASARAIKALPAGRIDAESSKALLRFMQDLPHPTGFFTLDVSFKEPFQLNLGGLEAVQMAQNALSEANMTVRYTAR